jgi:hypothetical protein
VKWKRNECAQLMENIHPVLYAIINLYLKSETVGSLAPVMLDNIGRFMEWVGSSQEIVADELLLELFTRYMLFSRRSRMETSSSTCFTIAKRTYSKGVLQD